MLSWMAWTWPTALVFIGIFSAMAVLTVLEIRNPGGDERLGALGLVTTRGDRLFISLLGSTYIFLAWLGLLACHCGFLWGWPSPGAPFASGKPSLLTPKYRPEWSLEKITWICEFFSIN